MSTYVLQFQEIDRSDVTAVGGKGANLGELSRIDGLRVPDGFCVTTEAFRRVAEDAPAVGDQLDQLAELERDDHEAIRTRSAEIRRIIEGIAVPEEVTAAITGALAGLGERAACAVRSSATAEDLPGTSFAGQHDSYLNVIGSRAVLQDVRRCWASSFTERAVTYRLRNGFDHRKVHMAVVVQRLVVPQAAGVLFTADPATSNRTVASIEATFGFGEALVSGRVNPDVYTVRDGEIVAKAVGDKAIALRPAPAGGTHEEPIDKSRRDQAVLADGQALELVRLGRLIEAHLGCPQDIEWCLVDGGFQIVQSRPITTLFPVPETDDGANHVYVSVGHQQMMTDAMKPLGLSMWQLTTPRPMAEAGGRLFVEVTHGLTSSATRPGLLDVMGRGDPLIRDALQTILDRRDFIPLRVDDAPAGGPHLGPSAPLDTDPAIVTRLIAQAEASIDTLKRDIRNKSGPALFDFILADLAELKRALFDPRSLPVILAAMDAAAWLNEHLQEWLGETNPADTLTQSVPHNVTSEMGLALLDVADAIRPHPAVVSFLRDVDHDGFLDDMHDLDGGPEAQAAMCTYLDKYGMRCVGEIDITRPRWSERPTTLVPLILSNVTNFEPGAAERHFEEGRREASAKEQDLLERLRALPDGDRRAEETKQRIDFVRAFTGYREYPKYGMICRYFVYKQALMAEAASLVRTGVLRDAEDVFYLRFDELHDAVRTNQVDDHLIAQRKEAFRAYQALRPPRVLTSDGETLNGAHRRSDLPARALAGLAVSAGMTNGRARVILDMAEADLEPGDILVTAHTDPSWSPVFVTIAGLVTEVGGLMTHGAVIAREYGLPAVVGVDHATRLIQDGQQIRVNGTDGYIEILDAS